MDDILFDAAAATLLALKAGLPLLGRALRMVFGEGPILGETGPGRAWRALGLGLLLAWGRVLAEEALAGLSLEGAWAWLAGLTLPELDAALAPACFGLSAALLFGLSLRPRSASGFAWGVVPALGRASLILERSRADKA